MKKPALVLRSVLSFLSFSPCSPTYVCHYLTSCQAVLMKRLQFLQRSSCVLSGQIRIDNGSQRHIQTGLNLQSTVTSAIRAAKGGQLTGRIPSTLRWLHSSELERRRDLPSPPVEAARESAKLAALHSRLYLPSKLPIETLARTLVHKSADVNPEFNNTSLATLGHDLLSYYTSEYLLCRYPRLPLAVVFAAVYAYIGPKTLNAMRKEWGVDLVHEPGGEVDPGLLQFVWFDPLAAANEEPDKPGTDSPDQPFRRALNARIVYDNEFTDLDESNARPSADSATVEQASASFVRAVMGALYLHAGRPAAKRFFEQHFLSRHLNVSELFSFSQPARDLSRLCAREGFELPVARIISETGRRSRHPVFNVGVYSGADKLGEGAGASLAEARTRAAVAALKGWYLYSPLDVRVPSSMEEKNAAPWKPVYVDLGEVIV